MVAKDEIRVQFNVHVWSCLDSRVCLNARCCGCDVRKEASGRTFDEGHCSAAERLGAAIDTDDVEMCRRSDRACWQLQRRSASGGRRP